MEWNDIKNLSVIELKATLSKIRAEQHALRLRAHNRTLKQVHKLKANRRLVAQILTSLSQRSATN